MKAHLIVLVKDSLMLWWPFTTVTHLASPHLLSKFICFLADRTFILECFLQSRCEMCPSPILSIVLHSPACITLVEQWLKHRYLRATRVCVWVGFFCFAWFWFFIWRVFCFGFFFNFQDFIFIQNRIKCSQVVKDHLFNIQISRYHAVFRH